MNRRATGGIVAVLFAAVLAFIGWRAVDERQDQAAAIAYTTSQGVVVKRSASGRAPTRELVEPAIERAPAFWCEKRPADCQRMREALRGARLGFVDGPVVIYAGRPSNMAGATLPRVSDVALGEPDRVLPLVTHELAHQCLFAAGVPGADHHRVMAEASFGW